jgi:hypothetical protein
MRNVKILSSADENYFYLLKRLENNCYKMFGSYPEIYDLGMTEEQLCQLLSNVNKIPVASDYSENNSLGFIKTTHKADCIIHFLENNTEDCLYLDADILFSRAVEYKDLDFCTFDVAVTPRHIEERYEKLITNGNLNAGVMFFKNNEKTLEFIKSWKRKCEDDNQTDQLAMSQIICKKADIFSHNAISIDDVEIKFLDASKYNDVSLSDGLILHYKNAGRSKIASHRYLFDYLCIQNNVKLRWIFKIYIKLCKTFKF